MCDYLNVKSPSLVNKILEHRILRIFLLKPFFIIYYSRFSIVRWNVHFSTRKHNNLQG